MGMPADVTVFKPSQYPYGNGLVVYGNGVSNVTIDQFSSSALRTAPAGLQMWVWTVEAELSRFSENCTCDGFSAGVASQKQLGYRSCGNHWAENI